MNKTRKILIVALCLVLVVSLALIAACNKNVTISFETNGGSNVDPIKAKAGEDITELLPANPTRSGYAFTGWYSDKDCTEKAELPTVMPEKNVTFYAGWVERDSAKLTLTTTAGGTLAANSYDVFVGDNVAEFLADKAPTPESGLEFGGWFEKGAPLAANRTMPASGLTLEAKYLATYSVNLYVQDLQGNFPATANRTTGKGFYGEAFTYAPENSHFKVDNSKADSRASSASLGKSEEFTVYLLRDKVTLSFYANEPIGTTPATSIPSAEYYYGTEVKLPNGSVYEIPAGYRFGGWATSPIGNVAYAGDQTISLEDTLKLYAKWEVGLRDVFGGVDYLFVSISEADVVHLYREGFERASSSYNPETGIFVFENDGKEVLSGRITADGFYYFYEAEQRTYESATDSSSLELKSHGEAVYKPESGSALNGTYEVNFSTGDYVFRSGSTRFEFRLDISASSASFIKRGDEHGYYAQYLGSDYGYGYQMLYLDGYGGGREIWDPDDPYVDMYGIPHVSFDIQYRIFSDHVTIVIVDDESTYNVQFDTSVSGTFEGYRLSGVFRMEDEYEHLRDYNDRSGSGDWLSLDGYGNATYGRNGETIEGTYETSYVAIWFTINQTYYSYDYAYDTYLEFTAKSGEVVKFRLIEQEFSGVGGSYYQYYFEVIDGRFGIYDFDNMFAMEGEQYTGFIYFLGDGKGSAQLWVLVDFIEGNGGYIPVYVQLTEEKGKAENGKVVQGEGDGVFVYQQGDYNVRFKFVSNDEITALDTDLIIKAGELYIDGEGVAWYIDDGDEVEVEYVFEEGMFVMYTFEIDGEPRIFILEDSGNFIEITADKIFDVKYLDENRVNNYTARIIMMDENEVLVGLLLESGAFNYALIGSATAVQNKSDEYEFVMEQYWLAAGTSRPILEEYGEFRFKLDKQNQKFFIYDAEYNLTGANGATLTTDGYGVAHYKASDSDSEIEGTYATVENVILFHSESEQFVALRLGDTNTFAVIHADESLGYYYTVDEEGYTVNYFFFDGAGVAIFFQFNDSKQEFETFVGSYELDNATIPEEFAEEGFKQYHLTFGNVEYRIVAKSAAKTDEGDVGYFVYYLFDEAFYYDGDIVGGGHIYVNGFETVGTVTFGKGLLPTLDDDATIHGMIYRTDIPDSYDFFETLYLPAPNANGSCLIFIPLVNDSVQFIFDITQDGAVLRTQPDGTYVEYRDGMTRGRTIRMDGHGVAYLRDSEGNELDKGSYEAVPALGNYVYRFVGAQNTFVYRVSLEIIGGTELGDMLYVFTIYTEDDGVYLSEDPADWTVFVLDGFGGARYVDEYGRATEGSYSVVVDDIIVFRSYSFTRYISLGEHGYVLIKDEFIIKGSVLYAYQGKNANITIPSVVTEIAAGAFSELSLFLEINFNNVVKIGDSAFAGSWIEVVNAPKVEYVGERAFYDCYFLKTVKLPKAKVIGEGAFIACNYLTSVVLGDVEEIHAYAFTLQNFAPRVIFDLTAATHPENIAVNANAFIRTFGGKDPQYVEKKNPRMIDFRIIVKDMQTLNAIYASDSWKGDAKKYATVTLDTAADAERLYYDFAHHTLYNLNGGLIIETYYDETQKGLQYASPIGIYTSTSGKFTVYLASESGYDAGVEAADVFTLGDKTLFRSGGQAVTLTTDSVELTQVTIEFTIIHDQDSERGEYVIYGIKVNGVDGEIDTGLGLVEDDETIVLDTGTGVITVTLNGTTWEITVTSATTCTVVKVV